MNILKNVVRCLRMIKYWNSSKRGKNRKAKYYFRQCCRCKKCYHTTAKTSTVCDKCKSNKMRYKIFNTIGYVD